MLNLLMIASKEAFTGKRTKSNKLKIKSDAIEIFRHVTSKCTPKAVTVSSDGLVNNIECSIAVFKAMIEEHAEPEIASLIIKEVFRNLP